MNQVKKQKYNKYTNKWENIGRLLFCTKSYKRCFWKACWKFKCRFFEIEPKEKYSEDDLDWTDDNSRVTKEHEDKSLRNVELKTTKVENWDQYDTVLIGYPIWWGIAAWPVDTFVKTNDFSDKTVIPFCTSASSGLGESGTRLQKETKGGNWK